MKKKSGKSNASEMKQKAAAQPLNPDVEYRKLGEAFRGAEDKVVAAEKAFTQAKANLESARRLREYQRSAQAIALASAAKALTAVLAIEPYEPGLRDLLLKVGGWQAMVAGGASDAQIRDKLSKAWSDWNRPGYHRESTGRGGDKLVVWIDPADYNAKATLEGNKLVSETRRVLGIPMPAGGKDDAGTRGNAEVKKKSAPKAKPAASKSMAKRVESLAKPVKMPAEQAVERVLGGEKKAAAKPDEARAYSRYLDGVRKALKRMGLTLDKSDARLRSWFDENLSPAAAANLLKADPAVPAELISETREDDGKSWGGDAGGEDDDEKVASPAAVKIEAGKTYAAEELKLSPKFLDAEIFEEYSILPRAPEFKIENTGRIGTAIEIGEEDYVVVMARMQNDRVTYTLHPIFPTDNWTDPVQSALQRWSGNNGKALEEIKLKGVRVEDDAGEEWILGEDAGRIYVTCQRAAIASAPATDDVDDEGLRKWYAEKSAEHDSPPLTETRLETIRSITPALRHLLLDPKLNDHGIRVVPEVIRVHSIPAKTGTCDLRLYQDLDDRWWVSTSYEFKLGTLGGMHSPTGPSFTGDESQRFETKVEAIEAEIDAVVHRLSGKGSNDAERGAVKRFVDGLRQFRGEVRQKIKEFTGTVKHTPAKAKEPTGPRTIATARKDSLAAWYGHFKSTLQGLPGMAAADPGMDAPRVVALYNRYIDEDLRPADAARELHGNRDLAAAAVAEGGIPGILKVGDLVQLGIGGDVVPVKGISAKPGGWWEVTYHVPLTGVAGAVESLHAKVQVKMGNRLFAEQGWEMIVNPAPQKTPPAKKKSAKTPAWMKPSSLDQPPEVPHAAAG